MASEKSSRLSSTQKAMQKLVEHQKQALAKCCPYCWGSLERETIISLRCPACDRIYYVEDLLKGAD
ncbi:MAG TPA: hypothetical protein ENN28_04485 [Candidatus Uhrbacteria bacterium]|nr:hypothetical protein [Candidatus Uhrbacteria bacterium]